MFRLLLFLVAIVVGFLIARMAWFGSRGAEWTQRIRVRRVEVELEQFAKQYCPNARVSSLSPPAINGNRLAFLIQTDTDAQRDRLREDPRVFQTLPGILSRAGYPPGATPSVHIFPESQETVDRDFGGSWREALS